MQFGLSKCSEEIVSSCPNERLLCLYFYSCVPKGAALKVAGFNIRATDGTVLVGVKNSGARHCLRLLGSGLGSETLCRWNSHLSCRFQDVFTQSIPGI